MFLKDGKLILGTGNGGAVYSVRTDGEGLEQLIDTEAKQVTALATSGAEIMFATANKGSVGRIAPNLADKGSFTSTALDAGQIVRWGTMRLAASARSGAKVTVATRSGNLSKPDEGTWSSWSKEQAVNGDFLPIMSPSARFLQYRLTLTPGKGSSPVVSQIAMIYQMANLPPVVAGVMVKASSHPGEPKPVGRQKFRLVLIKAADPNRDKVVYKLEYRRVGSETWVRIAEKYPKPMFVWDTQTVGDGEYELRVTASDLPTNVATAALTGARISERILVDNSPPLIQNLSAVANGTTAVVSGNISDAVSRIVSIAYTLDSKDAWKTTLPADGMCDSRTERLTVEIKDLSVGAHRIAVRVTDRYGNVGYGYANVTIAKK